MRHLVLAGVALALAACSTVNPSIPPSAEARLRQVCRAEPLLHGAFVALSPRVSPRLVAAEAKAHRAARAICEDPPHDAATALAAALQATAVIAAAQIQAAKGS